jgi:hypothetical protein
MIHSVILDALRVTLAILNLLKCHGKRLFCSKNFIELQVKMHPGLPFDSRTALDMDKAKKNS